jgi:DNA-binding CsgD family transcriptional regulator
MQDYISLLLENGNKNQLALWPTYATTPGTKIFFDKNYWHGLTQAKINEDNIECSSFLGYKDNHQLGNIYIKHHNILEKVSNHFKEDFKDIIDQSEQYKATFENGYNFELPKNKIETIFNPEEFLQAVGIYNNIIKINEKNIHLSQRELQCLKLISAGLSIKDTAKELLLSPRTVETNLNRIKDKTGVSYKSELIKIYSDML